MQSIGEIEANYPALSEFHAEMFTCGGEGGQGEHQR